MKLTLLHQISSTFNAEAIGLMKKAATVEVMELPVTDMLEMALSAGSDGFMHDDISWEPGAHRNTSVGDVIVIEDYNEAWQCRREEWKQVSLPLVRLMVRS